MFSTRRRPSLRWDMTGQTVSTVYSQGYTQCVSRTDNGVPVPHLWERGGVEVFQPKLVIFRAEPDIDASIRTCVPSKHVSSQILANHPQTFQWLLPVQWIIIFRWKVFAQPGNRTQDLLLSVPVDLGMGLLQAYFGTFDVQKGFYGTPKLNLKH